MGIQPTGLTAASCSPLPFSFLFPLWPVFPTLGIKLLLPTATLPPLIATLPQLMATVMSTPSTTALLRMLLRPLRCAPLAHAVHAAPLAHAVHAAPLAHGRVLVGR